MPPIVIKLGGSLYNTPELTLWLKALVAYSSQQPIVIVPGGGPFADLVRDAQKLYRFDDKVAHHMAIVAMKQFGVLLMSLEAHCNTFSIDNNHSSGLSVWLPEDSLLDETDIKQCWSISSDSLALWLANRISAQQLLLIKRINPSSRSIKELSEACIVDAGFSHLFSQQPIIAKIIHDQHHHLLAEKISDAALKLST
jgi:aspartokinase-like uncharacterized kinase